MTFYHPLPKASCFFSCERQHCPFLWFHRYLVVEEKRPVFPIYSFVKTVQTGRSRSKYCFLSHPRGSSSLMTGKPVRNTLSSGRYTKTKISQHACMQISRVFHQSNYCHSFKLTPVLDMFLTAQETPLVRQILL